MKAHVSMELLGPLTGMVFNLSNWCLSAYKSTGELIRGKDRKQHTKAEDGSNARAGKSLRSLTKKIVRKPAKKGKPRRAGTRHTKDNSAKGRQKTSRKSEKKATRDDASLVSEGHVFRRTENDIFRDRDTQSIRSEPTPTSILGESFYCDDSLGDDDIIYEVDYTASTPLFEALEQNDWSSVLFFLRTGKFFSKSHLSRPNMEDPEIQVRTWVHCKDDQNGLLWRQLPLHGAICLDAPLRVIEKLVAMYPEAIEYPDSYGNTPFDLASQLNMPGSYVIEALSYQQCFSKVAGSMRCPPKSASKTEQHPIYNSSDISNPSCTEQETSNGDHDNGSGEEVLAILDDDEFELYYY